jgi:hypothetical protein
LVSNASVTAIIIGKRLSNKTTIKSNTFFIYFFMITENRIYSIS